MKKCVINFIRALFFFPSQKEETEMLELCEELTNHLEDLTEFIEGMSESEDWINLPKPEKERILKKLLKTVLNFNIY